MTDFDYESLDRVLPAAPGPADWEDVLTRFRVHRSRRRRRAGVLAAVAFAVVVTASAVAVRMFVVEKGFIGLPPVGATASAPPSGELVLAAYGVTGHSRNKVWVYRDGRVIFVRAYPPGRRPDIRDANALSSGFLERRLTAKGVELLRSHIVATGLFGHDRELAMTRPVPFFNYIHVRNGGRLVRLTWHQHADYMTRAESPYPLATREQATTLQRLIARITEPEAWLPASEWVDAEPHAYVPSRFAIVYGAVPTRVAPARITPARLLGLLPEEAKLALQGARRVERRAIADVRVSLARSPESVPFTYYVTRLSTAEARRLAGVLDASGLEPLWSAESYVLSYELDASAVPGRRIFVTFEPILPHGEPTCSACG
jgi:hypothetical protein